MGNCCLLEFVTCTVSDRKRKHPSSGVELGRVGKCACSSLNFVQLLFFFYSELTLLVLFLQVFPFTIFVDVHKQGPPPQLPPDCDGSNGLQAKSIWIWFPV